MKKLFFFVIAGAMLLLAQQPANGQLISNGSSENWFGQPDNSSAFQQDWIRSIGIGYFGSNYTNSLLHIDGNNIILPANGSINSAGEVFRTDAPSGNNTFWRMLRGNNQIGYIWNNQANNHFNIQAHQTSGNIDFYTSPNTAGTGELRMTILPDGNVGIGTTNPAERLSVDGNILATGKILVASNGAVYDLLAMITQLQNEVNDLKGQLTALK